MVVRSPRKPAASVLVPCFDFLMTMAYVPATIVRVVVPIWWRNAAAQLSDRRLTLRQMAEPIRAQVELAIKDVSEGACPLCHVRLVIHDGQGCCPCCGDAYKTSTGRLEMRRCEQHGRNCHHWDAIWAARI